MSELNDEKAKQIYYLVIYLQALHLTNEQIIGALSIVLQASSSKGQQLLAHLLQALKYRNKKDKNTKRTQQTKRERKRRTEP